MESYFAYWKRGWLVLAFIIGLNVALGLLYAGLAFLLKPMTPNPFPIGVALSWLVVGAPFAGWFFEKLVGWSGRINPKQ